MNPIERRMAATVLEVRDDDADGITLTGYASTFNDPYNMGWYTETVAPSAFNRTLGRNPDVRLLINHGDLPLARTISGTLTLDTDKRGLRVQTNLDPSDPDVARLVPKMKRGDLNQMSFAFRVDGDSGDEWTADMNARTLRALDLHDGDVSVVTYPANPNAAVGLRSTGPNVEAVTSALRVLEARGASEEDIVSILSRALGYFTAIDTIVDNAQEEIAESLGIPNPDDEATEPAEGDPMSEQDAGRSAVALLEYRTRALRIAG
jgi:HK97 family phage prohead protease